MRDVNTMKDLKIKLILIVLAAVLASGSYLYILHVGKEYRYVNNAFRSDNELKIVDIISDDGGEIEILGFQQTEKGYTADLRAKTPGHVFVYVSGDEGVGSSFFLTVHKNGVITQGGFLGDCTGFGSVIICLILYLLLVAAYFIKKYIDQSKKTLYGYDNISYCGLAVFAVFFALAQIRALGYRNGLSGVLSSIGTCAEYFTWLTLPVIIVTTVIVTKYNIELMMKEGKNWRNMLAVFLALFIGFSAFFPVIIGEFLQRTSVIDVHKTNSPGHFFELFSQSTFATVTTYLECILIGSIAVCVKAAKHVPAFDKDYILILGCQVRKDGTLPMLLQSRVDRALEFADMQKKATGKDIIFVPTGGQGSDEVIPEGEAIRRYLLENGIPEDRIIAETKSVNTEENFRLSLEKIREHRGSEDFKAAFSTTNYHVFRSGMLAQAQGIRVEGIGSKTKKYFWINAFVREFIATIYREKKKHLIVTGALILINLACVILLFMSEIYA